MAFRDHLGAAGIESSQISLIHEMMHHSQASGHAMTVFDNITECPGIEQRSTCSQETDCVRPLALNPKPTSIPLDGPWIIQVNRKWIGKAKRLLENIANEADLTSIPIPHHWPQDRGRYSSASIIIAQDNGIRNVSFHRQFLQRQEPSRRSVGPPSPSNHGDECTRRGPRSLGGGGQRARPGGAARSSHVL